MREETVTIRVPPGIPEGATLRLAGHGLPSPWPGGLPGDASVSIRTRADPRFTRAGADLRYDLHIQAPDAALGATMAVPVPGGQVRVRVPPGTQPGTVLRVAGPGLPRYGGHGRGSLNLTVILDIPRRLSPRQRQLYEQHRAEDAGTRSTTDGSGEPDAPRSGRRITADAGGRHAAGRGLLIIASVPLLVIGVPNLAGGIAAIAGSQILIVGAHSVSGGLRAWGWGMAVFGVAQLLAAAGSGRAASGPDGPMVRRGSGPAHRCRPDVLHPRLSALAGGDEEMPLPDGRGWPDQNHGSGPHTRVLVLAVRASVAKSAAGCRG